MKKRIGLFDSGVGGLSVLKEFVKRNSNNDYIYFGDTSRVPYGNKSPYLIREYSLEICNFLIKENVDLIVIACGTATSVALEYLKEKVNIPIIGVIEPTVKYINKNKLDKILLIGTLGSVNSKKWNLMLNDSIESVACPLFVPLVEENVKDEKVIDSIINLYLKDYTDVNNIILGCTHYPFLKKAIKKYYNRDINLIDLGEISSEIFEINNSNNGTITLYFSDINSSTNDFIKTNLSEYKYDLIEKKLS